MSQLLIREKFPSTHNPCCNFSYLLAPSSDSKDLNTHLQIHVEVGNGDRPAACFGHPLQKWMPAFGSISEGQGVHWCYCQCPGLLPSVPSQPYSVSLHSQTNAGNQTACLVLAPVVMQDKALANG